MDDNINPIGNFPRGQKIGKKRMMRQWDFIDKTNEKPYLCGRVHRFDAVWFISRKRIAMSTESLRIDSGLAREAGIFAKIENRSKAKQIEYWAKIGRIIAPKINIADVFAVSQGIKTIKLEMAQNAPALAVDSDDIFDDLEVSRANGSLANQVTSSAPFYFEKSLSRPGYLDRVDTLTGERVTGIFENGEFTKF